MSLYCGCLLLLASLGTTIYRITFLRRAAHADATIVGYLQNLPGRGIGRASARDPGFRAIFVYRSNDGRMFRVTSPEAATDHVPLRPPGTRMGVFYDPADPAHALPDTWSSLWTGTLSLGVLGASLLAARFAYVAAKTRS